MPVMITMPKWGLAMKVGTIREWLRAEGAEVAAGDPLLEVETDKALHEVEAPAAGTLRKIVAQTGEEIPIGDPLAIMATAGETLSDEEIASLLAAAADEKQATAATQVGARRPAREARAAARGEGGRVNASPAARKLAQELGIDLSTVLATGPGGRVTSDDVERAAAELAEAREEVVTLPDGTHLFSIQAGRGRPPLVFLHGLGGSQSTWQEVLPAFAERHRVCALDLPGHGASDKPSPAVADYSLPGIARLVADALDVLHLTPATLVGHSLGGAVALHVALERPDAVSRLVLVDSLGLGEEINPELLDRIEAQPRLAASRRLLELFFHNPLLVLPSGVRTPTGSAPLRARERRCAP
ncbi:MAG: alpha/beta fold hydrolase [Chloroflexi bacterium]|nr:alpha/beta fold hydrolase [Chloroflexota bacterium]